MNLVKQSLTAALLLLFSWQASANLLINPTRVSLAHGERSTDVTLINTSQVTNTYRLEWVEKRAKEGGGYYDLTEEQAAGFPTASQMIRFSPRQVTLAPNERQTVRLAVRRPSDLVEGEYRSHLMFRALPPQRNPDSPGRADGASTAINIVLSFAIPVVVRQGLPDYNLDMSGAQIAFSPASQQGQVAVNLTRSGKHSTVGDVEAYWTPNGGSERLIAKVGEYSLWPELNQNTVNLAWVGAEFAPADGKLRIVYTGSKEFRGITFFERTLDINRSAIQITP